MIKDLTSLGEPVGYASSLEQIYICPRCQGKLFYNLAKSCYHCFQCGLSGFYKQEQKIQYKLPTTDLNIQRQVANWIYTYENLSPPHEAYLKSRGIFNPYSLGFRSLSVNLKFKLTKQFGLESLKKGRVLDSQNQLHFSLSPDRVFFPYWYQDKIIGLKTRSVGESLIKYSLLPGSDIHQYPFQKDVIYGVNIYTEGEFKALVANSFGYNCISLPGISPSTICLQRAKESKHPEVKKSFLVLDYEPEYTKNFALLTAIHKLSEYLKATIVVLPGINEKVGLDDFLLKYDGSLSQYLDEAYLNRDVTKNKLKTALYELKKETRNS